MRYLPLILTVFLFSTVNAQTVHMTSCDRTLYYTMVIHNDITEEDGVYTAEVILSVPVEHNQWLLEWYSIDDTVYIKGNGKALGLSVAIQSASVEARAYAACLNSEEIRLLYTVEKDSWIKKSFFQKIFKG